MIVCMKTLPSFDTSFNLTQTTKIAKGTNNSNNNTLVQDYKISS
jgi:hypothetical protein